MVTVDVRLYLQAKTKTGRRLNRQRPPEQRIPFRNKNSLARRMLEALRPLLPQSWRVYSYAAVDKYMVVILFFMLLR